MHTLPTGVRETFGRGPAPGVVGDRKPLDGTREGMPRNGVVSVILRGIPRDRSGMLGADDFFRDCASEDFCRSSVRSEALFGLRFNVKCFVDGGCWPT